MVFDLTIGPQTGPNPRDWNNWNHVYELNISLFKMSQAGLELIIVLLQHPSENPTGIYQNSHGRWDKKGSWDGENICKESREEQL